MKPSGHLTSSWNRRLETSLEPDSGANECCENPHGCGARENFKSEWLGFRESVQAPAPTPDTGRGGVTGRADGAVALENSDKERNVFVKGVRFR